MIASAQAIRVNWNAPGTMQKAVVGTEAIRYNGTQRECLHSLCQSLV